jgi:hypothetical protein
MAASVLALLLLGGGYFAFGRAHRVHVYPAHGQVFFEANAIPNATLLLEPAWTQKPEFPAPRAVVKEDGSFQLGTYGPADGAPAGEYKVVVQWLVTVGKSEVEGGGLPRNALPARYARFDTSGLRIRIQAAANEIPPLQLKR